MLASTASAEKPSPNYSIAAGAVAFLLTFITSHARSTPYNNFTLLAQGFLRGHLWIHWPGSYIDALAFAGKHFIIEAPLPAVLMMPMVAIWGLAANQTLLATILCGVSIGAAWELARRYGVPDEINLWLCAFLLAGTDLLWAAMLGDVWFIAHVAAVASTLLALVELAGKRRGWLVALYAACAIESRFTMLLAIPVYAYLVFDRYDHEHPRERWVQLRSFIATLIPFVALWILYNYARWGVWNDIGYTTWYHQDSMGEPTGSPFRLSYLVMQLNAFFVQLPTRLPSFPWLRPEIVGVALTWTSPALVLALFARKPVKLVVALWIMTILCAAPNFIYYVDGFAQFGMRHALDFEPFLFALMAIAVRDKLPRWGAVLIGYSCVVGLWGCWYWNAFIRPNN